MVAEKESYLGSLLAPEDSFLEDELAPPGAPNALLGFGGAEAGVTRSGRV